MFKLIQVIGSLCLLIAFAVMNGVTQLFPEPYGDLLLNNKWPLFVVGVILSIYGFVINLRAKKERFSAREKNVQGSIYKKNYHAEQQQYKATEFVKESKFENKDLALKVDWTPLSSGSANFKTNQLVKVKDFRIEVIRSIGAYLFSAVFMLMGAGIPATIAYMNYKDKGSSEGLFILTLFALIFIVISVLMMMFPRPRVFDKQKGWFWAGKKSLNREQDFMQLKKSARLSDIAAIQILSGNNSSYTSWQINLVSHDAQRLNVMDHGNKQSIINDAQLLGDFLGVPVWENS